MTNKFRGLQNVIYPTTMYQNIDSFLKYYGSIRRRTRRVISAIPPDKIEWRPRPDAFSFGDQIRHLAAIERYMFVENAMKRPSSYPGCGKELADGYDHVLRYLDDMHEESVRILQTLTPEQLLENCITPGDTKLAIWKWLRAMIEHEIHHRSQIYVYLGLLGVPVPQLYGLTSEEVQKRSR